MTLKGWAYAIGASCVFYAAIGFGVHRYHYHQNYVAFAYKRMSICEQVAQAHHIGHRACTWDRVQYFDAANSWF